MSNRAERLARARSKRKRNTVLSIVAASVAVLALALVIWQASGRQPALPITAATLPRVSAEETYRLMEEEEGVLYDVRSIEAYRDLHAAGAMLLPETDALDLIDTLPEEQLILLY